MKQATKVSNKVRSKIKTRKNVVESEVGSSYSLRTDYGSSDANLFHNKDDIRSSKVGFTGDAASSFYGSISQTDDLSSKSREDRGEKSEERTAIHNITSKAEAWMSKKAKWPWKGNKQEFPEARSNQFGWRWLQSDQDNDQSSPPTKSEFQVNDYNHPLVAEASELWSSLFTVNSRSSASSCGSTSISISSVKILDIATDCLDYEIFWEDLIFEEQIGQGSCGTVYHGLLCGSDVAIKVFSKVEYSEEAILSFRQEGKLISFIAEKNI